MYNIIKLIEHNIKCVVQICIISANSRPSSAIGDQITKQDWSSQVPWVY